MDNAQWARLHRLLDPQDIIRDREINGDQLKQNQLQNNGLKPLPRLSEEEFRRKVDESDRDRDAEGW